MRRTYWAAGLVLILAVGIFGLRAFLAPASGNAQQPNDGYPVPPSPWTINKDLPATDLAISQVILYSNGVGYFQREGLVQDNARVDLTFPVQNINDLLKSMVLQDLGNGHISAVSYDSHDPIDKTLKSFAVNLTNNPSFGQILNQGRGEKIEVHSADQGMLTGTLVGVESRPGTGKDPAVVETLNLLGDDGMRGIRLDHVKRVRFVNAKVEAEMRRALEVLASARDAQKKTVSLNFTGAGQRKVKVGYVVEQPVWRTSYRLLVNNDGKLFMQGWAIVENTSNEDWKDVKLSLVSGRPISFQMDLYQPLYVNRPMVQPEQIASIQPQTHAGARAWSITAGGRINEDKFCDELNAQQGPAAVAATKCCTACARAVPPKVPAGAEESGYCRLQQSVASAAKASDLGDYFQYAIEHPVTVARQKSAMIPIVNKHIQGTKVSLYNPATHPKYPLLAVEVTNNTNLHLMQGPVTVFEGSSYAGDAPMLDLQRGDKRLLSYAIDLGTEVEQVAKKDPAKRFMVKIKNGTMTRKSKVRENTVYSARSGASHDRILWIEHPYRADFKLISKTEPRERTDKVCRYELSVPAGKSAKLVVAEEKVVLDESPAVSLCDRDSLRQMLQGQCTSMKLTTALKTVLEMQEKLAAIQQDQAQKQQELQAITTDQQRLRANLKEMPESAAAYKRYLAKFDRQETEIEKLQEHVKARQNAEQQQRRDMENYLKQLDVEGEIVTMPPEAPESVTDGQPSAPNTSVSIPDGGTVYSGLKNPPQPTPVRVHGGIGP
jgi:hypothetical protein